MSVIAARPEQTGQAWATPLDCRRSAAIDGEFPEIMAANPLAMSRMVTGVPAGAKYVIA
jgi:hypothetical protein